MSIIIEPIITEKMTAQSENLNRYGFIVNKNANKIEIAKEVEAMYGVVVESVNTIINKGKSRSRHTKAGLARGRTNAFKKAIVKLAEGEVIDFYSNI